MHSFTTPLFLYLIALTCLVVITAGIIYALWRYFKALEIAPVLIEKKHLEADVETLRLEKKDLDADLATARALIADGAQMKNEMQNNQNIYNDLLVKKNKMQADYAKSDLQLAGITDQVTKKQQRLAQLTQDCQKEDNRLEALRKEKQDLRFEVEGLKAEKGALQAEIPEIRPQIKKLEKEKEDLEKAIEKLQRERDSLNKEIGEKKGIVSGEKEKLNRLISDIRDLKKEKDDLAKEVAGKKVEEEVAIGNIKAWESRKNNSDDIWKNLSMEVVTCERSKQDQPISDELQWLQDFQVNLSKSGFLFHERSIKAFHTSLKCAETTPLVVLAGISGTGKSLLPELYAHALGMNFLPVPVQPRWDSPQDLFGFYNYMEGRYKATELARLLWQFDVYNNPDAQKKYRTGGLPMNLVLLDEMNLARVEYYFSDLLSKLEIRNGLDPSDAMQRAKAEIELECNAVGAIGDGRRLFVSPHTLFVGTMNEDESTQTLSDKVVDRSNVLRFGRPALLKASPRKTDFIRRYERAGTIDARTWDRWHTTLSNANSDDRVENLRKILSPINDVLDLIDHPYAFRVDRAMANYVLNYPDKDPTGQNHAIADQIELKILPKLNGVEKESNAFEEVRDKIKNAIDSTGDSELAKAFMESCNQETAFFKWRGVKR